MQSHERVLACDVYRAGDGVHAVWLEERLRGAPAWTAGGRVQPIAPLHARDGAQAVREPVAAARDLQLEDGARRDQARFGLPDERLPVIYNAVDSQVFSPGACASIASACARKSRSPTMRLVFLLVGSGFERKGVAAAIAALAQLPAPAHLVVVGRTTHLERYKRARASAACAAA